VAWRGCCICTALICGQGLAPLGGASRCAAHALRTPDTAQVLPRPAADGGRSQDARAARRALWRHPGAAAGLLGCWAAWAAGLPGLLGCWAAGLLGCWAAGTLEGGLVVGITAPSGSPQPSLAAPPHPHLDCRSSSSPTSTSCPLWTSSPSGPRTGWRCSRTPASSRWVGALARAPCLLPLACCWANALGLRGRKACSRPRPSQRPRPAGDTQDGRQSDQAAAAFHVRCLHAEAQRLPGPAQPGPRPWRSWSWSSSHAACRGGCGCAVWRQPRCQPWRQVAGGGSGPAAQPGRRRRAAAAADSQPSRGQPCRQGAAAGPALAADASLASASGGRGGRPCQPQPAVTSGKPAGPGEGRAWVTDAGWWAQRWQLCCSQPGSRRVPATAPVPAPAAASR
jgi:hypothetical protein